MTIAGDPTEACEEFLHRDGERVFRYLLATTGNRVAAEDLRQEVAARMLRAFRNGAPDHPLAFAIRTARNLASNRFRHEDVMRRALPRIARDGVGGDAPDSEAARREMENRVAGALADLPEREREAVAGKIHADLTWVEIGRLLGVSDDTAARLFARGLRRLRETLGGFAP